MNEESITWIPMVGIKVGIYVDPLSVLFVSLISFFSLVIIIYSIGYMAGEEGLTRYYFFIILFIGAMNGLVISDNFFQMFIFWEMVGLCSYSLVSFYNKKPDAVKAGMKVFLMTRVGDVCFLAAIVLLYTSVGSFSFSFIIAHIDTVPLPTLNAVAFLVLGGAIAKSSQLPLHTWLYSAMEAPTSVSALLHGATMVKAGVYLLARLFVLYGSRISLIPIWLSCVSWIGAITGLIGAILALHTNDIKGVPAYSTVSQIGFMIAAIGSATSPASLGWFAGLFHMFSHAFFQGLGFLAIGGIVHSVGTRDMRQMGGLRKQMPITFILCVIVVLARTGVPPFASFFSKGLILTSLWSSGDLPLIFTIYAGMAITFSYTLRFIILVFFRERSDKMKQIHFHEPPKIMLFAAGILAALCCVWGFLGSLIGRFMQVVVNIGFAEIFSPSTLIFLLILCIGGFPIILIYYNQSRVVRRIRLGLLKLLDTILRHGFYFDDFYDKIIANGTMKFSRALNNVVENSFFERIPQAVANGVMRLGKGTIKYFDVAIDKLISTATTKTIVIAAKIKKKQSDSLQRLLSVALIGFLIIISIILFTT